jgi:hypothetical protein
MDTSRGMLVAEHYMEAIADKLNLDIDHVRQVRMLNFITCGYRLLTGISGTDKSVQGGRENSLPPKGLGLACAPVTE